MEKSQVSSSLSTSLTGHVGSAVHLSTMHVTKLLDQSFTETNSFFFILFKLQKCPQNLKAWTLQEWENSRLPHLK